MEKQRTLVHITETVYDSIYRVSILALVLKSVENCKLNPKMLISFQRNDG